ncbi:heme-binding protein [Mycolicibacterium confluentis]|nr:heme-binding protein [Mycolicibacterium confluentis]MCV7319904.1 heme-binding protein [Mycolicibacterium confluentis]ORV34889.1 hypothetical protein AWB99_02310 [Mycolicibacterium confluentis]
MTVFGRACGTVAIAGAIALGSAPVALADPPNCTAADLAGVMSGVTASTSEYLFTHPDVNTFFTGLKNTPKEERRDQVQAYLDANPQVGDELRGIRQPAKDFRARCDVPMPE